METKEPIAQDLEIKAVPGTAAVQIPQAPRPVAQPQSPAQYQQPQPARYHGGFAIMTLDLFGILFFLLGAALVASYGIPDEYKPSILAQFAKWTRIPFGAQLPMGVTAIIVGVLFGGFSAVLRLLRQLVIQLDERE